MSSVRRVVTGHTVDGKAAVASDEYVPALTAALAPGHAWNLLWGTDVPPRYPDDGAIPLAPAYFPPVGGIRFMVYTVGPMSTATMPTLDRKLAFSEFESKFPGCLAHMEPESPGMHITASVDFEYVISGEVWLELDDGKEILLRAGDTVVQNGTRHAWRNRTTEPCRMAIVLVGAHHARVAASDAG